MKNSSEVLKQIVAFGDYEKITGRDCPVDSDEYVSAGNPGLPSEDFPPKVIVSDTFVLDGISHSLDEYNLYTVLGHSMETDGILDGYRLLTKRVIASNVETGDFIIIKVDKDFYRNRHNGNSPLLKKKLRRAVGLAPSDYSKNELFSLLNNTFAEPFTKKEKSDLIESWCEAKKFFGGRELFLSVTYHNGRIHYSFHPSENILFRVEGVAFNEGNDLITKGVMELAS